MTDREIIRDYNLRIQHYNGEQTREEVLYLCDKCLLRSGTDCKVFEVPIRESQRMCISNYRIDQETLVDAIKRKCIIDNDAWNKWISAFPEIVDKNEDEARLYVIKSPDDMIQVHRNLESVFG